MSDISQEILKAIAFAPNRNIGIPTIQLTDQEAAELERRGYTVQRNGQWTVIQW